MSDLLKLAERWEAEAKEHSGSAWTRRCEIARHLNRCARELRAEVAKKCPMQLCPGCGLAMVVGSAHSCPTYRITPPVSEVKP